MHLHKCRISGALLVTTGNLLFPSQTGDPQNLILSELQSPLVGHPGESITASFLFRGIPFPEINWTLNGVRVPNESRPNFDVGEEALEDGTTTAWLRVTDAGEMDCGVLNATVRVLDTLTWTAGHLIIIREYMQ